MESLPRQLAESGAIEMRTKLASISGGTILDIATGTARAAAEVTHASHRLLDHLLGLAYFTQCFQKSADFL